MHAKACAEGLVCSGSGASGCVLCTNSLKDIYFIKNFNKTCSLTTSKEEHDQPKC